MWSGITQSCPVSPTGLKFGGTIFPVLSLILYDNHAEMLQKRSITAKLFHAKSKCNSPKDKEAESYSSRNCCGLVTKGLNNWVGEMEKGSSGTDKALPTQQKPKLATSPAMAQRQSEHTHPCSALPLLPRTPSSKQALPLTPTDTPLFSTGGSSFSQGHAFPTPAFPLDIRGDSRVWTPHPPQTTCWGRTAFTVPPRARRLREHMAL